MVDITGRVDELIFGAGMPVADVSVMSLDEVVFWSFRATQYWKRKRELWQTER